MIFKQPGLRPRYRWGGLLAAVALLGGGCLSSGDLLNRGQSPDLEELLEAESEAESRVRLVGDLAGTIGMNYFKVEGIALVCGLNDTGSDPAPTPRRAMLMEEMKARKVERPNHILASPKTSLVLVRGYIPPGVQEGDRFDVEVYLPARSETTSLRGGRLMEVRLKELKMLGNAIRSGKVVARAWGNLLVDALVEGDDDEILETRARILGGAVALKSRPLGLVLRNEHRSVRASSLIGDAINQRFHSFDRGIKRGVAKPMRDNFIELSVYPRYKNNIVRYVRVVTSIPVREAAADRAMRLQLLDRQLNEPTSAARAALRLEALGKDGVPALQRGLDSDDPEVRFYAAEALAYLDEEAAAEPLGETARQEPAFRLRALNALSAMDDLAAYDVLSALLDVSSAETRYGAFRALRTRSKDDPLVQGENLKGQFGYHVIPTEADPMIHIARTTRPEIVVFGREQHLLTPLVLFAGKEIMVKSLPSGRVKVSRFAPGKPDESQECSSRLDDVIRAIANVGGTYPDVVAALRKAKQNKCLQARLVVNSLPKSGRTYHRRGEAERMPGGPVELSRDVDPLGDTPGKHPREAGPAPAPLAVDAAQVGA